MSDLDAALQALREAAKRLGQSAGHAAHIFHAQAAMGWVYRGDLDRLHEVLERMTPDQLQELSTAAALLGSAADEALREKN
ncbi:hypothetical protein Aple_095260 [Acrocarpospora pleiomorpha]|uniref:ANTAR domain-containing protein n=1 Tax=Acrocarpospora pleiomorpha TaxID=90975 RepID=A0A5M3XZU7_9ACTN|nr:hypothetical protein [Acrocarpospora pleiomorpha]GES26627.1 hypothetical protein Aple_095260 [Acrocarpospora pleiomorpha]